jgi:hypothetical protein
MPHFVSEMALVSPLGLSPAEHLFYLRAEVSPNVSGAFIDADGESLPVRDCAWIPASRPWSSRLRLLAKHALSRLGPLPKATPIVLIAPREAAAPHGELQRFLALLGHTVVASYTGQAAFVTALQQSQSLFSATDTDVVLLAVDSQLEPAKLASWLERRYSTFTRNPLPPSEGAAAIRLTRAQSSSLVIRAYASSQSPARDDNDLPTDGAALTRVFAELGLPPQVPLILGPSDVDPLRGRDWQLASARHHARLDRAQMPGFEARLGDLGTASGLMSAVYALAHIRHGLAPTALCWARSADGTVAGALLGGAS